MQFQREIQICRCFYESVQLPLQLSSGKDTVYSLPEIIPTAASVTGLENLSPKPGEEYNKVQYLFSPVGERFLVLRLPGDICITAGPFLAEPVSDEALIRLVREGMVKMRMKSALRIHLDSLILLPMKRYYYSGLLLELLFVQRPLSLEGIEEIAESPGEIKKQGLSGLDFLPDSFYLQTRDYRTRQFLHSPYMTEQEICRYISSGDTEGALRTLAEINLRPRAQLAGTEARSLKNSIICSCAFMTRAAISGGVRADDAFTLSDAYIRQIETCSDIRQILHFEEKMVVGFTSAVIRMKKERYSDTINRAVDYIEEHLCEKLSLESIAESVFLNPNYLSGLFHRETGETIHHFIVRRRVEDSSFFVRSGTEPIADIASFYQFSSQSHYVRSFRTILGVTPGEYRKGEAHNK
ncbi:MAG: AraC family transcriptional regulator [Eubacteriales bacterium]|nr:AraC family transcriptional regulator [Eubacteriales bacterium]